MIEIDSFVAGVSPATLAGEFLAWCAGAWRLWPMACRAPTGRWRRLGLFRRSHVGVTVAAIGC